MGDLSTSFNPADIAVASDAASSAMAAASDAASKAGLTQSKASDASSAAVVAYSKASDASSAAAIISLYAKNATQQVVVNDATEQTIFSATITGGSMTSTGMVKCRIAAQILNNSGATKTVTIKVKYGATTLYGDVTAAFGTGTAVRAFWMEFILANQNSTSAQIVNGLIVFGYLEQAATGIGDLTTDEIGALTPFNGTATEDSTGDKTLAVTIQFSAAHANTSWTTNWVSLERWA